MLFFKRIGIFIFVLAVFSPECIFAQVQKRSITLEWEEIPESTSYDVEVTRILADGKKKSPIVFKSKKPSWTGKIFPGKYEMRLRSLDTRGVKGEWSEPSLFWVKLPAPEVLEPKTDAEVKTNENEEFEVTFKWRKIEGGSGYRLEIFKGDKAPDIESSETALIVKDTESTSESIKLPVAARYSWRVTAYMPEDKELGEKDNVHRKLTLIGKKLLKPKIEKPDTKFVTELSWNKPEYTQKFSYAIQRKNEKGKWEVLEKKSDIAENNLKLNPQYPGGQLKLSVKAQSELRETSDTVDEDFYVYEGSRTPAAIEEAKLREAIEKEYNSYFIASYLVTILNYEGMNRQDNKGARYNVLGGTGRIGYGYFKPKSQWGFLAIADTAGVIVKNKNHIYSSVETQGIYRTYLGSTTQLRVYSGLFLKQLPEVHGPSDAKIKVENVTSGGPHAGFQLWQPLSYKLGVQLNGQLMLSAFGIQTPNGEAIEPTLSYQIGVLGSYKMKENITGFAGYAYRVDSVSYKAKTYSAGSTEENWASPGDVNEATYRGHYLNLYLEWGF